MVRISSWGRFPEYIVSYDIRVFFTKSVKQKLATYVLNIILGNVSMSLLSDEKGLYETNIQRNGEEKRFCSKIKL
jgi:hypothetical protein